MTLQQPEGMDTANELVATSSQQQQYDLMGAGNKGACFIFDLFKKEKFLNQRRRFRKKMR